MTELHKSQPESVGSAQLIKIKLRVRNRCQLQNARFYRGPHAPRNAPDVSTPTSKPSRPHCDDSIKEAKSYHTFRK